MEFHFPRIMRCSIPLILIGSMAMGCAGTLDSIRGPMTYTKTMDERAGGFRRSYRVHIPAGYSPTRPPPLVVVLHGAFATAEALELRSGFSRLADREGFAVLYPNGMGILGFLQHWNAGHCCGKAANDGVDDAGFVLRTIDAVAGQIAIDRDRVYLVGHSNGGMLAFLLGAAHPNRFAAMATVAGAIGGRASPSTPYWQVPTPIAPLPVMMLHGGKDIIVPMDGGHARGDTSGRSYKSASEAIRVWVTANRCHGDPALTSRFGGGVHHRVWGRCEGDTEVQFLTLTTWPHVWPGPHYTTVLENVDPFRRFDAAREIWKFLKPHRRNHRGS